jgi:tRNA modification GTPase
MDDTPIVALSTPQGSGALALIRISGNGAVELVDMIAQLATKKLLVKQPSHTIHYGSIVDTKSNNQSIDAVLFLLMRGPKTFTGHDTVEISCHNNPFIINQIIQLAVANGAHHAQRGEFSKRAVLNKKIDLLQAEAINDLITAQNEVVLRKSLSQLKGTLSHHIQKIEDELLFLLSMVEASFEFLDEEQRDLNFDDKINKKLTKVIKRTDLLLANFSQQQQIRQGVRIAIIGSTNVGKSTLFNALVKQDRAIVTNIPGTTRDAIETSRYKNGNFWLMIDTAGLRETDSLIEKEGIDRSWQEAAQSDIILLVSDSNDQHENNLLYKKIIERHKEKVIMIVNKIDLLPDKPEKWNDSTYGVIGKLYLSAKNKIGINNLEKTIKKRIDNLCSSSNAPFLLNQRQYDLILELNMKLKNLQEQNKDNIHHEIMAYHLKQLIELVSQLTGKTINEQMIDTVFSSFCIGK